MTQIEVDAHERRLIIVVRAITTFGQENLVSKHEASNILVGLESVFDLDKLEADLDAKELNALVLGVVGGIAAVARSSSNDDYLVSDDEFLTSLPSGYDPNEPVAGAGPSSAVPAGQVKGDPGYVTQTGPRKDQEV